MSDKDTVHSRELKKKALFFERTALILGHFFVLSHQGEVSGKLSLFIEGGSGSGIHHI